MSIATFSQDGHCRLHLEDLTIYTAPAIVDAIRQVLAARPASLTIDLAEVAEIDTAGLQALLVAREEAGRRGIPVKFPDQSPAVAACLGLLDLAHLFDGESEMMPDLLHPLDGETALQAA